MTYSTKRVLIWLVVALIGSAGQIALGQAKMVNSLAGETAAKIDGLFSDIDDRESPGYAIGVVQQDRLIYAHGYGMANLDYDIPIAAKTLFPLASVSKRFTAACIALLILENQLSLEDDAADYLPELKKYNETIRIKHLLYNTSGLAEYYRQPRQDSPSWITFYYFTIDDAINRALAIDKLAFTPGSQWAYNNVNFMLLTRVVEAVSGQSFPQFAATRLFQPLGMTETQVHHDMTQVVKNRAIGYNIRNETNLGMYRNQGIELSTAGKFIQHHRNAPHYGGSGIYSSVEDLARWCANFYTGAFGGQPFDDLMHRQLKFDHGRNNQAFGIYFSEYRGRTRVAWDGGDWGISAEMVRFVDQHIAIICLSNLGSGRAADRVAAIADILIEADIL